MEANINNDTNIKYSLKTKIKLNLIVAVLYYLLSIFIINLPITGEVVYFLWPAAGLAIAAIVTFGEFILFGVFFGALFVNFRFGQVLYSHETADLLFNSVLISVGAVLSPYISYIILKIFGLKIKRLQDYKEIFGIFVIGGILGSIITSTVGSLSLYYNRAIGFEKFIDNWGTWWIGDSLGVFLFFPIFYQIFNYKDFKKRRILLIAIPIMTGVLLSTMYHVKISMTKHNQNHALIQDKSTRIFNRIVAEIENKKTVVESVKAFFESSDNVTRDDFYNFTNVFLNKLPELSGIMWAPRYLHSEVGKLDKEFQKIYDKTFSDINKTAAINEQKIVYPVMYAEPFYRMVSFVGHDISNSFGPGEMELSYSQRNEFLVGFRTNEVEDESHLFLNLYFPVYYISTHKLNGYVASEINFSKLIDNTLEKLKFRNIDIQIYQSDVEHPNDQIRLFSTSKNFINDRDIYKSKHSLRIGRTVLEFELFEAYSNVEFKNLFSENIFIILSLFFTGVMGVILLLIVGQRDTIAHVVDLKTIDLQNSKIDIEKSANKFKEVSKSKGQFLQVISTDIKRMLIDIEKNFDILEKNIDTTENKSSVQKIRINYKLMNQIVDDVIYYSEVDSDEFKLIFSNFNLYNMLESVIEKFATRANAKNLRLQLNITGNCPEYIYSDKERLLVVLHHLVDNAISYTAIGGIEIVVSSQELQNHMSFISFSVRDTGPGIADADLRNIFSLSSTIKIKKSMEHNNSGLGLVISSKILKHLGSEILASSVVNKGSEFSFSITAKIVSSLSSQDFAENDYSQFANLNVLFCEDNQINQKIIAAISKKLRLNYDFASNGNEAVEIAMRKKMDVIFMDINMPKLNGFDATREIRMGKLNALTPIVALTLNIFEETRQKTKEIGMCDFIEKPIRTVEIIRILRNVLDKKYNN